MPLQPVPFQDFSGGVADQYIGTDVTRAGRLNNFLIDETKKPYVRYGTFIFPNRGGFSPGEQKPSGLYLGPQPFSHPVEIVGPHAYVVNELALWSEIQGPSTAFLQGKTDSVRESATIWRRQLIVAAPVTSLPPAMIYSTFYVQPSTPATPAAYRALTLGLPALASSPTIAAYDATDAYQCLYAFFYKCTFIDYTGTLFAFFGNPNIPGFVTGSSPTAPETDNIVITDIPTLANGSMSNYDTDSRATTSTTFVAGSLTAVVTSATGIVKGAQLICAKVTPGTVVTGISGTAITLSAAALTSGSVSTVFSTLTIQIYRTINGGSVFFYAGMVANATANFTDSLADEDLQLNAPIYTSGGALGYDQPPTNAIAVTQTNDTFWYATANTLYQSISGAPGACPSSFATPSSQRIIGLSDVNSFPILFCDKSVYRVEGTYDSFGNGSFALREISNSAGCLANSSVVKITEGLVWFGNGGLFFTDGYNVRKISKHLNISYQQWANASVTGDFDPTRNMAYWTINSTLSAGGPANAFLILHLSYGIKDESAFSTADSANNYYPTAMRFSSARDIADSDPLIETTGTWTSGLDTMVVDSASGIVVGQTAQAVGIPFGTTVIGVSGTSIQLSVDFNEDGDRTPVTFSQIIFSQLYNRVVFSEFNGYMLWFDPNALTDVKIDTNFLPTAMAKKAIIYDYTTAGLDQGTVGFRKYNPDVILEVDSATPVAIQIQHRRDDGGGGWSGTGGTPPPGRGIAGSPGGGALGNPGVPEIRQDGPLTWNITDCLWETDSIEHLWNDNPTLSGKRSVPAAQLRSGRRQLRFTNSYTVISNSDTLGLATVLPQSGAVLPTVTLDDPSQKWITDPEGYYITFVGDSYNQTFVVLSRVSDLVIQIADPFSLLTPGSKKWEMKGFRKFERPRLVSFTLNAEIDGPTFGQATTPQGANT